MMKLSGQSSYVHTYSDNILTDFHIFFSKNIIFWVNALLHFWCRVHAISIGYTMNLSDLSTECCKHEVDKLLRQGVYRTCTMTTHLLYLTAWPTTMPSRRATQRHRLPPSCRLASRHLTKECPAFFLVRQGPKKVVVKRRQGTS